MKQTWRWFGPYDPIPLADLHMVGVEGIVTALHDIPPGEVWTPDQIAERQDMLARANYTWDVVESLPVSEAIKTQSADCKAHLENYRVSLTNLAAAGVETICYNFMPILDWTRTTLRKPQPHGGNAMAFDLVDFAAFDLFILKRAGAADDFDDTVTAAARARFDAMSDDDKSALQNTVIMGLPGANDGWSLDQVQARLDTYAGVDRDRLRQNLIDFLGEVVPLAEDLGMRLCCHPDDPPWGLLGLPRVMSSLSDYETVLNAVDSPANGATLCTGSLGVASDFDGAAFVKSLGPRIHFAHLRNTKREGGLDPARPNFFEAPHLGGDTDMVATIQALMAECNRRRGEGRADWQIPMRPDHGVKCERVSKV